MKYVLSHFLLKGQYVRISDYFNLTLLGKFCTWSVSRVAIKIWVLGPLFILEHSQSIILVWMKMHSIEGAEPSQSAHCSQGGSGLFQLVANPEKELSLPLEACCHSGTNEISDF